LLFLTKNKCTLPTTSRKTSTLEQKKIGLVTLTIQNQMRGGVRAAWAFIPPQKQGHKNNYTCANKNTALSLICAPCHHILPKYSFLIF
jgi:hypothetical protein